MDKFMPETNKYTFRLTGDGSVGLYNHNVDDIYHSSFGAKNEAKEKFIIPLNFEKNFMNKKELKILDICYGIGYNTKAILEKILLSNYNGKVKIDILEYDKSLVSLSPIIRDGYSKRLPQISLILFHSLLKTILENKELITPIIENKKTALFFTPFYTKLIKKYRYWGYKYNLANSNNSFLHNIYSLKIMKRNKRRSKCMYSMKLFLRKKYSISRSLYY